MEIVFLPDWTMLVSRQGPPSHNVNSSIRSSGGIVNGHYSAAKEHSRALEHQKTRAMLFPTSVHRLRGKVFRPFRFYAVWQPCSTVAVCKYFCFWSLLLFRRCKCPTSVDGQGYQVSSAVPCNLPTL
ncbi:hypothetical protein BJX68DRAFT_243566 [Aspergillus pseudodeflectus]|uniref:Uncharacterized protein n=1 Tax=Aspergillus pseudodeflectus TaxID=176178 RepID=A0ABR4JVK2_9EURO